jgi:hypothetical protein
MGELAQLITSIATLLGVGLSIYISLRNSARLVTQDAKIESVKAQTNGMLAHLESTATKVGHAAGVVDEKARAAGEAAK